MFSSPIRSGNSKFPSREGPSLGTTACLGILAAVLLPGASSASAAAAGRFDSLFNDWRFGGRLQVDGARYNTGDPRFIDDVRVRRARLALSGELFAGLRFKFEYEFGGNSLRPRGMFLRKKLGENSLITVGNFKVPISLQTATSSLYNTFMERSLSNVGTSGYRLGMMVSTYGDFWSAASGITGGKVSGEYEVSNEGVGAFARVVFNPARSKNHLWHFGLGSEIRRYGTGDGLRLRSRPESYLTNVRLVDTLRMTNLDQSLRYTAEFAWKHKSLGVQAEYMGLNAKRLTGPDLEFSGWYAQAGWFITGESRRYDRRKGRFRRTTPERSFGAWEVAVRYSAIDLNSFDILGGEETNTSVALNWYATESLRFSLNYIDASARRNPPDVENNVSIVQARFQFIF